MAQLPYGGDRPAMNQARVDTILGNQPRMANGGRVSKKPRGDDTSIHIVVNAKPDAPPAPPPMVVPAPSAAPPMMPPDGSPPPGAPDLGGGGAGLGMGLGGPGVGPGPVAMRRGGRVARRGSSGDQKPPSLNFKKEWPNGGRPGQATGDVDSTSRKTGGRVRGKAESTAAKTIPPPTRQGVSDKERRFASGGVVQSKQDGAGGGLGRLNKARNERRS